MKKKIVLSWDDNTGMVYDAKEMYIGRKRLGDMRIKITKFGKSQREEAIKWQKEELGIIS